MSKNHFITTSRFVLSLTAAGIVGLTTTHAVQADEVATSTSSLAAEAVSSEVTTDVTTETPTETTEATTQASVVETTAVESATPTEATTETVLEAPVVEEIVAAEAVVAEDVASEPVATEEKVVNPEASSETDTDGDGRVDTITIAHTNDMHGRIEQSGSSVIGIANASQYYEEVGADVVVDAGDAFQGLPVSNHDQGATMAEATNQAGYDAMAVGNHEFDFGQDVATAYEDKTGFPVLSVNTVYADTQEYVFTPSTNVSTQGYNLGVVGVTTPETATKTHPNNVENIEFLSPIETTISEISRLIADDTTVEDAFIVLAHLGIDATTNEEWRATALATALDDVEAFNAFQIVILDGHSHSAYADEHYGNVLLQQTGTALNNIGLVSLNFVDPSQTSGQLVAASDVLTSLGYEFDARGNVTVEGRTDEAIQAILDEASLAYEEETGRIIVEENPVWFNGVREYVRSHETNAGTYITDAMVEYGRNGGFVNATDFAMINGGGIREQIAEGEAITEGDVIAVLPFGNIISQIEVTGETIYEMFELAYSAATITEPYTSSDGNYTVETIDEDSSLPSLAALGGFLQISSDIKVYFDPTLAAGQRVLGVYVLNRETGEFELVANDTTATYFMATNDFLAQGGDGYTMLSGEREEGPSLDQVVMDAMEFGYVDLASYADPLPQNQIIPILTADYKALLAAGEETPVEEEPTTETLGEETPVEEEPTTETPVVESGAATTEDTETESNKEEATDVTSTEDDAEKVAVAAAATASLPETGYAGNFGLAISAILGGLGLSLFPSRKRK